MYNTFITRTLFVFTGTAVVRACNPWNILKVFLNGDRIYWNLRVDAHRSIRFIRTYQLIHRRLRAEMFSMDHVHWRLIFEELDLEQMNWEYKQKKPSTTHRFIPLKVPQLVTKAVLLVWKEHWCHSYIEFENFWKPGNTIRLSLFKGKFSQHYNKERITWFFIKIFRLQHCSERKRTGVFILFSSRSWST